MVNLTETEKEILALLVEGKTVQQIANIKGYSTRRYVYQVRKRLIDKGLYNPNKKTSPYINVQSTSQKGGVSPEGRVVTPELRSNEGRFVVHAQQFVVPIIWKGRGFRRDKLNRDRVDGNYVVVNEDSVEVYAKEQAVFKSDVSARDAWRKAVEYWDWVFGRLENDLDVYLIKDRRLWKEVKQEVGEVDNELAQLADKNGNSFVQVKSPEGRVWLQIDLSPEKRGEGGVELETKDPATAVKDMDDVVQPVFNDWREHGFEEAGGVLPTPSEAWKVQVQTLRYVKEIGAGLAVLVKRDAELAQMLGDREGLGVEVPDYIG